MTPRVSSSEPGGPSLAPAGPLLVTADPGLTSEAQRLAAAAGAALEVTSQAGDARCRWSTAPVVLVGPDVLLDLAETSPLRRDGVHVVTLDTLPDELFRLALAVGAESVVELPAAEGWMVETLTDAADGSTAAAAVVGVVGGCGGAGATTFATALAMAAASGVPGTRERVVTLVDADPFGPGIERIAGLDDVEGARWGPLLESAGRFGSRSLRAALPGRDSLSVLGWGPATRVRLEPDVVRQVVSAARRGSELVVMDLPRYVDPATVELLHQCDHLVLVTTLTLPAVAAGAQVASSVLPIVPQAHLVARGPATALDPDDVADALGIPLAAVMPDQRRLAESVELGLGPLPSRRGPLARAVRVTLARVAS